MKTYVVHVYDTVAIYDIKAASRSQAEKKAAEEYRKEKHTWLGPKSVEVVEELDREEG